MRGFCGDRRAEVEEAGDAAANDFGLKSIKQTG